MSGSGFGTPPVLGASTMGHSTQGSLSIVVLPPEEGNLLTGGASVESARLLPGSLSYHPEGSMMDVSSDSPGTMVIFLPQKVLLVDATISLHPLFMHRLDVGPIRLTTIAHAFNYRVAVLRDGVKSAAWVGSSRRAADRILEDVGIPWGHQVAVMFQIVCALALEVPSVLQDIESLHGVSPNVSLACEPWGHTDHTAGFPYGLENRENREQNNGQGKVREVREFYLGPKVREKSGNFVYFRPKVYKLSQISRIYITCISNP